MKLNSHKAIFLLLTLAAFLGHSMVPHDHHYQHQALTHSETHDENAGEQHQGHCCYAFNSLDLEKNVAPKTRIREIQVLDLLMITECIADERNQTDTESIFVLSILPAKRPELSRSLLHRGPPLIC